MKNLKVYDDIINQYQDINAWTDKECFPVNRVNECEIIKLKNIIVVEILFPGGQGDKNKSDILFNRFDSFVNKYVISNSLPIYIFKAEFKKMQKNRIRSYNGVLPKNLSTMDYIEVEFNLPNNYSIIAGISRLTADNVSSLLSFIFDSTNCFIISTQENILSKDFVVNLCEKHLTFKGITTINYLNLCMQYCLNHDSIYRVGGDGGDQEITLQIFTAKQNKEFFLEMIAKHLG